MHQRREGKSQRRQTSPWEIIWAFLTPWRGRDQPALIMNNACQALDDKIMRNIFRS